MVLIPVVLFAGAGFGVWLIWRALRPRPVPIPVLIARLDQVGRPVAAAGSASASAVPSSLEDRLEQLAGRALERLGLGPRASAMFDLTGRVAERHALDKVLGIMLGVLGPASVGVFLWLLGAAFPMGMVLALSAVGGVAGFVYPDLALRDQAARRRRAFRHALSAYLDLVNILLAGGAGIETALFAAADAGDGWAFDRLRTALDLARTTGQSPWATFADLGRRLEVSELAELAASISLAGSHGARIRASLGAKADALRGHQVAETEAKAEAATERMAIPLAVLLFGFLILIGYPAIDQITSVTATAGP